MYRYTGVEYSRLYLRSKSKRLAWETYMKANNCRHGFSGLRRAYKELFTNWDDESYWTYEDSFFDDYY